MDVRCGDRSEDSIPNANDGDSEARCCICLDPPNPIAHTLTCMHAFCVPCISRWLQLALTCPLCKTAVKALRPIGEGGVPEADIPISQIYTGPPPPPPRTDREMGVSFYSEVFDLSAEADLGVTLDTILELARASTDDTEEDSSGNEAERRARAAAAIAVLVTEDGDADAPASTEGDDASSESASADAVVARRRFVQRYARQPFWVASRSREIITQNLPLLPETLQAVTLACIGALFQVGPRERALASVLRPLLGNHAEIIAGELQRAFTNPPSSENDPRERPQSRPGAATGVIFIDVDSDDAGDGDQEVPAPSFPQRVTRNRANEPVVIETALTSARGAAPPGVHAVRMRARGSPVGQRIRARIRGTGIRRRNAVYDFPPDTVRTELSNATEPMDDGPSSTCTSVAM